MPIYEYECDGCHSVFEVRQKVSDPAPTAHSCGSKEVRRILSATSFVLKGTGWYATDYGNRSQGEGQPKSDPKPDSKAAAQSEGASPSKDKSGAEPAAPKASASGASQQAPPSSATKPQST